MVLTCKRKQRSIKNSRGQKLVRKEAINQLSPAKQREKGESKIKLIQAIKIKIWEDNQCTVCTNILTNFSFELKRILLTNDKLDKSIHVLFATFQPDPGSRGLMYERLTVVKHDQDTGYLPVVVSSKVPKFRTLILRSESRLY